MNDCKRQTVSIIVVNEHSVLARVSGLFAGRGYNIESLTVSVIPHTEYSRITITTNSSSQTAKQIIKQLDKLIPVDRVIVDDLIEKEMVLVKFDISNNMSDISTLCKVYNGSIVNVTSKNITAMVVDNNTRIESFIDSLNNYKVIEIVKGGTVAIQQ